jgi:hypothetical protein
LAIDERDRRSVHKAVNERSVRVLKNLLDSAWNGCRLSPIVILHRDYEYVFDFPVVSVTPVILRSYAPTAHSSQECEHPQNTAMFEQEHLCLQVYDLPTVLECFLGHLSRNPNDQPAAKAALCSRRSFQHDDWRIKDG